MSPYVGLAVDMVILGALGVAIHYGLRLSKQFDRAQADRRAFEQLIAALNIAASRAEAAIKSLKEAAVETGTKLQEKTNAARAMSEELEIMVQAGDNLAERLGVLAERGRKAATMPADHDDDVQPTAARVAAQPRSRAEKELLDALKSKQERS